MRYEQSTEMPARMQIDPLRPPSRLTYSVVPAPNPCSQRTLGAS
jgi:hypothetical protein